MIYNEIYGFFFLNSSPVTVSEKSYARSIFQLKKKKRKKNLIKF